MVLRSSAAPWRNFSPGLIYEIMKWDDIFGRFLDWTPGAVRAHWHILQGK